MSWSKSNKNSNLQKFIIFSKIEKRLFSIDLKLMLQINLRTESKNPYLLHRNTPNAPVHDINNIQKDKLVTAKVQFKTLIRLHSVFHSLENCGKKKTTRKEPIIYIVACCRKVNHR